ncbi:MAG: NADH:flavin oxidoreductase [Dehalococcoidales bacterium]|nr:NADH:flavin oxidoreductase [Dehalococcoidales bacterium]
MPGLFDTINIKGLALKNRIVMPPMATGMATEDGEITDRHTKHYVTRAEGGVGLIILEHSYVLKDGKLRRAQTGLYSDKLIPGLKRLVEAIHSKGAKVIIQLNHSGAKAPRSLTGKQPSGPWNIALPNASEVPRPLTISELQTIVAGFGDAAYRAAEAGFDSVEIHGAHGFLLCQFLSPYTNCRDDEYGGSLLNRLRFPVQVIKEVKTRIGENMPLFYRFGADDMIEGGLSGDEAKLAAKHLEQAGVDVIDVSGGIGGDGQKITGQGYFVPLAKGIKEVVKVPVIGVGNITEPEYADTIIREGKVDLVAIGRTLLSNPDFPKQAAQKLGIKL